MVAALESFYRSPCVCGYLDPKEEYICELLFVESKCAPILQVFKAVSLVYIH